MIMSSWSLPIMLPPFFSSTPTTRKGTFLMRMIEPTASPFGKEVVGDGGAEHGHLRAGAHVAVGEERRRPSTFQARMYGQSTPTP